MSKIIIVSLLQHIPYLAQIDSWCFGIKSHKHLYIREKDYKAIKMKISMCHIWIKGVLRLLQQVSVVIGV